MRICERLSVLFLNCYLITAIQKEDLLPYGLSKSDSIFLAGEDEISKVLKLKKPLQFYNAQFSDIYVATNGLLSLQPPPREGEYVSRGFPLGFPAIAPFLTDVDTSRGRGAVYYRYEDSLDILDMAAKVVQSGFTGFRPTHAVIVTWDHVASYEEVNTFQVVLAGNETDTYALFLYPEDGLQFFGTRLKPPHSPSVELPARVGFSRGEASITEEHYYSLTTSEQTASDLHTKGNSGTRGVWLFHIGSSRFSFQSIIPATSGRVPPVASPWGLASGLGGTEKPVATGTGEDVHISMDPNPPTALPYSAGHQGAPASPSAELPRPVPSQSSLPDVTETCPLFLQRCSQDSYCTDHPAGPCCHCRSGYYGNGRHCLPKGVSQRQNGRVDGLVSVGASQVQLDGVYLHGYAVVGEGRVYVSVSPVPEQAGWALMTVSPLVSMFGWLFALELRNHQNGFSITGAEFIHHSEMTFYPGNQHLTVVHKAQGVDSFNHLKMETRIHGDLPNIPLGAKVHIQPYKETYQYNHSVVTSSSLRDYTVASENGGSETFSYLLRQNVTFQGCGRGPLTIPDFQQLNVEHALVMYAEEGNILRYTLTNTVGPVGGELPELVEVNPCSSGKHYCDPMALCLPGEGVLYHCQCAMGFRGDGHNCYDVDECTEGLSSCGPHSQCVNMPGSHHCHCDAGYEFDFDWRACVDIDECWLKLCHSFASCSNSQGSFQCQCWPGYEGDGFLCQPRMCVTEQPRRPLAMCEQHRTSLQEGLSSWGGRPVEGAFIPKCDEEGQYSPTQCFGSTGHCWCVDSRGQERAGTWTLPGTPPVNCDNSPLVPRTETLCERWRQTLLSHYGGQPSPRDYLPQCGAQGHFLSVQCYGNSTFCWCVDKQGREVTGTRSHDAVRPACISTDPPLAQPFLYPEVTSRPTGPAILFAQAAQIGLIPLNGIHLDKDKSSVLLALQDSIVVGLDYECLENKLYWTDLMRQSISRVSLVPGAEPEIIINSGLTSPEGLAVDARHRKLFWVDSGTERIEVSELDGRGRKVLFDSDLVNPRAIVVDSSSGTLFWTDWDRDDPKIESSTLEGHERKVLVREGIGLPNALTLDPITRHLCWADAGTKRLECMAPDGTERKIIHSRLDYPFSLVNHGNHAYYTDWERDGILVLDKDTSRFTEYLPVQRAHLYGITVISSHCAAGRN